MTFINKKFDEFVALKYPEGIPDLFKSHLQFAFLFAYSSGISMTAKTLNSGNPMLSNLLADDLKKTQALAEAIRATH